MQPAHMKLPSLDSRTVGAPFGAAPKASASLPSCGSPAGGRVTSTGASNHSRHDIVPLFARAMSSRLSLSERRVRTCGSSAPGSCNRIGSAPVASSSLSKPTASPWSRRTTSRSRAAGALGRPSTPNRPTPTERAHNRLSGRLRPPAAREPVGVIGGFGCPVAFCFASLPP
jgi:hypothetical protein